MAMTLAIAGLAACAGPEERVSENAASLAEMPWDSVVARARGTTVLWRMWRGDPAINAYVDGWVAPRLKEQFGVTLDAVEGQGPELVNALVTEREAGADRGAASLMWINGETFAQLRRERLLAGPWAARLPNAQYIDSASVIIARDFEQDPAGLESPWGTVQFALIYDSARTPNPPRSFDELAAWIDAHPGRFTHDQGFTGITLLKMLMYAKVGGVEQLQGGFNEATYVRGRDSVFAWVRRLAPKFWRKGETYPPDVAAMHRLFANREIDFTMSNNQNEVTDKVRRGVLPATSRALLLRDGTIANAHFLGIPFNAPNAAGAMVVADFLLSPEAQLQKARPDVWADGTVLDRAKLPATWRARFDALDADAGALPADSLRRYARPEVDPMYHERMFADWRSTIRRGTP
ncbi:MAG TPA: ABC transporter substrate-binding protein [Gemmatimonas sp.]|nr:ABC transporter substrate-binding protein [Gemmatimonas sp.]